MRVLVVFAHPRRTSFTGALLGWFISGLREAGHCAEVADLYREGFDPCLREYELAQCGEVALCCLRAFAHSASSPSNRPAMGCRLRPDSSR